MNSHEMLQEGVDIFFQCPEMVTMQNVCNLRIAARLKWEQEEMGGLEYVQFAYRNNTPIVPIEHECHPIELMKRGYVDGVGWPEEKIKPNIKISKWFEGNHFYAFVDGNTVTINGEHKWNTAQQAEDAAHEYIKLSIKFPN